jgi:hypothetical protein
MNKFFTFLMISGLGTTALAQSLEFHKDGVSISGQVLTIDSAATADHTYGYYYIVNNTAATITLTWSREREAHTAGYNDQICDDILCFDADDNTNYNRPATFTIPANDSTVFQPKVFPNGIAGCAIYTYKCYQGLGSLQDSIQVKYRFGGQDCFLDVPETPVTYSVYPNPASTSLHVTVNTGGNAVQLNVYNIMGEVVMRETLNDGNNNLSVEELTNGVYFYSILKNGAVIETKKLIVRH